MSPYAVKLRTLLLAALLPLAATAVAGSPAAAEPSTQAFMQTLSEPLQQQFEAYLSAQAAHDFKLDVFWREVNDKRALRRRKKSSGEPLASNDYVLAFPPEYRGPALTPELTKLWAAFQAREAEGKEPPKPVPGVADFLANARAHYNFVPQRISEREFKARYAREALALGLTKDQVVRVYALETGGQGTADMQAGINPITKQGKPISTALGYAQLLHANSVNELVKAGPGFIDRLRRMAAEPGLDPKRAAQLKSKITPLVRMTANVKRIPYSWEKHQEYARTGPGMGIHALNLDGDIGPWLQAIKLKGLKEEAEKAGRTKLSPVEMELMNLAGPGTGLEMMQPVAHNVPTVNFFSRQGYNRNTIVRGKSALELLHALDKRMDENVARPGAVEFAAVFDEVIKNRQASGR